MDITKRFGKRVKEARLKREMSQADVAARLGLHSTYISQVERGVRNVSIKNVEKLARALGVSPSALLQ